MDDNIKDLHPHFCGDLDDLKEFLNLVETSINSDERGEALARWAEYNTVPNIPKGAVRPSGEVVKVAMWQAYRAYRGVNLSGASFPYIICGTIDLGGAILKGVDLSGARLKRANFREGNLNGIKFSDAFLIDTNFKGADIRGADFSGALLENADFRDVIADEDTKFVGADLTGTKFNGAQLNGTDFTRARLHNSVFVGSNIDKSIFNECEVYGISAWDLEGKPASSNDLNITSTGSPITVDHIHVAQFIYVLLDNEDVRDVIDTLTSKTVLILGRFTEERKEILDSIRNVLRENNYSPILFDFQKPESKTVTGTVKLLAQMARFVVVDLSDSSSAPYELGVISHLNLKTTPMVPLILKGQVPFSMLEDILVENWCLDPEEYTDKENLIENINELVIQPAEEKVEQLRGIIKHKFGN